MDTQTKVQPYDEILLGTEKGRTTVHATAQLNLKNILSERSQPRAEYTPQDSTSMTFQERENYRGSKWGWEESDGKGT